MFWVALTANLTACVAFVLMSRKVWWSPIFGCLQQGLWVWWCVADGLWPLLITALWFLAWYAAAIPKWYKERKKT